ncbi:Gustatory receptor 153, partial [Hyalella azteca]
MNTERIFAIVEFLMWFSGSAVVNSKDARPNLENDTSLPHNKRLILPVDNRYSKTVFREKRSSKVKIKLKQMWVRFVQFQFIVSTFMALFMLDYGSSTDILIYASMNGVPLLTGLSAIVLFNLQKNIFLRTLRKFKKYGLSLWHRGGSILNKRDYILFAAANISFWLRALPLSSRSNDQSMLNGAMFTTLYMIFLALLTVFYVFVKVIIKEFSCTTSELNTFVLLNSENKFNFNRKISRKLMKSPSNYRKISSKKHEEDLVKANSALEGVEQSYFNNDAALKALSEVFAWPLLLIAASSFTAIIFAIYFIATLGLQTQDGVADLLLHFSIASNSFIFLLAMHNPVHELYDSMDNCQTALLRFHRHYGTFFDAATTSRVLSVASRPRTLTLAGFGSLGRGCLTQ